MWENEEIGSPILAETVWPSIRHMMQVQRMLDFMWSSTEC